jgi:hypothetical protein
MRKLDEIIREIYIEEFHLAQTDNRYPMFLQIAATGLRELNFDLKTVVTEVTLPVSDNDTVNLPNNYIDYVLIAVVDGGALSSLGLNNNMSPRTRDTCGDLQASIQPQGNDDGYSDTYNVAHFTPDGQYTGREFGIGGGGNANGTYKVYKDKGYISLNGLSGDEIVLRYLADIEQVEGEFLVEDFLVDALKSFVWHRYIRRMRSYGITEKQMAEAEFNKKKKIAMKRSNRFNIPEFMNAFNTGYKSSPKI